MTRHAFDVAARRAAGLVSRRATLLTLGAAAITGQPGAVSITAARKKAGKTCRKKERKRCTNDAAACFNTVLQRCGSNPNCIANLEVCCDTCSANGFLTCLLAGIPSSTPAIG